MSTLEWKTRRCAAARRFGDRGVVVRSITWPSCAASRMGCLRPQSSRRPIGRSRTARHGGYCPVRRPPMAKSKSEQHQQDVELAPVWPDPPVESVGAKARTISGQGLPRGAGQAPGRAGQVPGVDQGARAQGRRPVRGPRRGRQGRRDQDHHRARSTRATPGSSPCRRRPSARRSQWYFQRYVDAPAGGRRDGPVRPQLVQPRRRRAGHGLLHRGRVPGVPALVPGVRADARPLRASSLIKYWFSVSDDEQERRFQARHRRTRPSAGS